MAQKRPFSQKGERAFFGRKVSLFLAEGLTVGALIHGRIHFVGTHGDAFQCAVVFAGAMMGTLAHVTVNSMIGLFFHKIQSFLKGCRQPPQP